MDRNDKIAIGLTAFFSIVFSVAAATAFAVWVVEADTFASQDDLVKEGGLKAEIVQIDNDWKAIFARMESERKTYLERVESGRKADLGRMESRRRVDLERMESERKADLARMESERKAYLAKIDWRFDRVNEKLSDINNAIIRLERSVSNDIKGLNRAIGKIEGRLDVIERHLMSGAGPAENQPSG